ncbi:MAG TPA: carboxypeptidase regulatory-like domain-containing protein [Gemmatimonadaceae bacterium]|nr:carboxypeptidase regulatory-like domain-containing protein [Gemmatimonadaceae bacterium]
MSNQRVSARVVACALALAACVTAVPAHAFSLSSVAAVADAGIGPMARGDITGTVTDSASGQPLPSAEVSVMQGGRIVLTAGTDAFGRYIAHDLPSGTYTVSVRLMGFRIQSREIAAGTSGDIRADFQLPAVALSLSSVAVTAAIPLAIDTRSGDQRFKQDSYHGAPTNTTSQILQQSIAGAARAPTGEVHIRGQHAEYTYYVDGVPVPAGISGSLNELFDPSIVNQIDFQTGGWDAEYGNKNAAVVNVQTRIPVGGFHSTISGYGGSFNTNGEAITASTNTGPWGFFVSGSRKSTDMRLEPVVFDTARDRVVNFHNHGDDYSGFAKVQYTPNTSNVFDLDASLSTTRFQVPYDSTGNVVLDDRQRDRNAFVNVGYRHIFGADTTAGVEGGTTTQSRVAELFVGGFVRSGGLKYIPGVGDSAQFMFFPDTLNAYNLRENRNFTTYGIKADYTVHPARELEFKFGTLSQYTTGHEDFVTTTTSGVFGPASNSNLKGYDVGGYAQTSYSPVERFEIRAGVRYDAHAAPFAGTQTQLSPRIRLNFFPDPGNTFYLYYGRLFVPTNVEDLRAITSVAQQGVVAAPTLPERDDFYEAGYIHRFPFGLVSKLAAYHKQSTPGIDDNTVPGSAIVTSVNIAHVRITGLETVQDFRPPGPFSAYLNLALNHAYGQGPITGGFFPTDTPQGYFDLDHDQRLSGTISATYAPGHFYTSYTGTYGSGLTNGLQPADCSCSYGTGLFDFNKGTHVSPSYISNVSVGYSFAVGGSLVRPELYVDNLFDKKYLLKGAFFSGASVGRPRSIQLRVNIAQ